MFSNRKSKNPVTNSSVSYNSDERLITDSGKISIVEKQTTDAPSLPPYQEYDLTNLLASGVNLEHVNPAILGNIDSSDSIISTLSTFVPEQNSEEENP